MATELLSIVTLLVSVSQRLRSNVMNGCIDNFSLIASFPEGVLHPDSVSKAVSSLLRRRVLFREGGARGDIGVNDPKDWVYVPEPKQTKTADSAQVVRIGEESKQTKTAESLLFLRKKPPM